jgi:hypothetical protein
MPFALDQASLVEVVHLLPEGGGPVAPGQKGNSTERIDCCDFEGEFVLVPAAKD